MRYLSILAFLLCLSSHAYEIRGTFFEKGSDRGTVLYEWQRTEKKTGNTVEIRGVYTAPDKSIPVVETATVVGGKLAAYRIQHKQLGTEGEVKVEGDKILFSFTKDGKTETNVEDRVENFVVSPTIVSYLAARREEILKGETVKVRYGVLDRKETVGFSLYKTEEKILGGVDAVVVKMKPTSFIISALVDPIYFTFRKSDFRSLEMVGRVLPKRRVDGSWKDLDCDIVYR
jgi:hypothetical protein